MKDCRENSELEVNYWSEKMKRREKRRGEVMVVWKRRVRGERGKGRLL